MRSFLLFAVVLLVSFSALADDIKVASLEKPSDPGILYEFIHGFAPETAVSMWRGGNRPALSELLKKRGFSMGQAVYIRIFKYE